VATRRTLGAASPMTLTPLEVVTPMTLNLSEEATIPTLEETVASGHVAVPTPASSTMKVVTQMVLNLKSEEMPAPVEEMPALATTLEGSDSNAAAWTPTTNSLNPTTRHPMANPSNSPMTSTRPTKANAGETPSRLGMGAEMSARPMPPTRPTSRAWLLCYGRLRVIAACPMYFLHPYGSCEDEVENGKDERDLSNYPIPVHFYRMCDVEYNSILNGQGTSKVYGNQFKWGAKSRRKERGYDLEKLWIGTSEGKDTRTIQYPLTSRWTKELS
jgi:hypothetical protein